MKKSYGRTLAGIIGFYVMQPLAQLGIIYLAGAYYASMTGGRDAVGLGIFLNQQGTTLLLIADVLCLCAIFALALASKKPVLEYAGAKGRIGMPSVLFLCVILGFSSNFWATFVLSLLPLPGGYLESYAESMSLIGSGPLPIEIITIVFVAPVLEELLFRGLIFDRLRRIMPLGLAVAFQGLLFGSLHGDPVWVIYAAILGCVLCYVRYLTNTVRASILVHIAFNSTSYIFGGLVEKYMNSPWAFYVAFLLSAALFLWSVWGINKRRGSYSIV